MELFGKSYIGCTSGVYPLNKNRFTDAEYIEEATKMQMPSLQSVEISCSPSQLECPPGISPRNDDDAECMFCNMKFLQDTAGELWIMCLMCSLWTHVECRDRFLHL